MARSPMTQFISFLLLMTTSLPLHNPHYQTTSALPLIRTTHIPPLLDVPTYSLATTNAESYNNNNNANNDTETTITTGMNILTYATPISIAPHRLWSIGLYKGTLAHENFSKNGFGILQLLNAKQSSLVRLLGGRSGRDVDKEAGCAALGFPWMSLSSSSSSSSLIVEGDVNDDDDDVVLLMRNDDDDEFTTQRRRRLPKVLPGCVCYLCLRLQGDLVDGGSHDVAICRVTAMFVPDDGEQLRNDDDDGLLDTTAESGGGRRRRRPGYLNTALLREMGIITEQGRVAEMDS